MKLDNEIKEILRHLKNFSYAALRKKKYNKYVTEIIWNFQVAKFGNHLHHNGGCFFTSLEYGGNIKKKVPLTLQIFKPNSREDPYLGYPRGDIVK